MPTRREQRHLRYTPPQLFDLVADVENYPKFLPGLVAVRVFRRQEDTMWIDMTIGLSIFEGRFTSKALLDRPRRIEISSDDPLFNEFHQRWTFEEAPDNGTLLAFETRFSFRSQ